MNRFLLLAATLPATLPVDHEYDEVDLARQNAERERLRAERDADLARRLAKNEASKRKYPLAVAELAANDRRLRKNAAGWADAVLSGRAPHGWVIGHEASAGGGLAVRREANDIRVRAWGDGTWDVFQSGAYTGGGSRPTQRLALIAAFRWATESHSQ